MGERLQSQNMYVCSFSDCNATFRKSWKLEAHLCRHNGLKPFFCENCEKSFCTRCELTRHERVHSGEKPNKCPADGCSEVFGKNASMKNHIARVHQHQEERYQCDLQGCGKDFRKKKQLKAHKSEHGEPLAFHCVFNGCGKDFASQDKLKHHEKVHQGYLCNFDLCHFQSKTWTEYLKHREQHKVKVLCETCKRLFNNTWFLHLHELRVHSGEKRYLLCPREGCDRKFTCRFKLESHLLGDHEGKKPFTCAYAGCGKSFPLKESLWRHGVVHNPANAILKKRKPKTDEPSQIAQEVTQSAADDREETSKLAAKLHSTTLVDDES
ncbi:general transcription factor IIIA, b isoform X1 [Girardinichthys multiradiatus]|uniref:general transcription factor IIIA, b isoform X1 n=1 Tax=Girardinichthys multiradiatus TaxID=208333 RepID=UPI001FABD05F|nr:general transcription factor IIIA, b isoform X1 [Girardinichthys multiradiatus]